MSVRAKEQPVSGSRNLWTNKKPRQISSGGAFLFYWINPDKRRDLLLLLKTTLLLTLGTLLGFTSPLFTEAA